VLVVGSDPDHPTDEQARTIHLSQLNGQKLGKKSEPSWKNMEYSPESINSQKVSNWLIRNGYKWSNEKLIGQLKNIRHERSGGDLHKSKVPVMTKPMPK